MAYSVITRGCSLIEKTADHLLCIHNSEDYSDNLIVFPGKRPAHFLRKSLADRIGNSYVPPMILSMEEFVDRMYETLPVSVYRKLETIDAVAFLFDVHKSMNKPLGGENFLSLDTFFPIGLRIFRDLEELLIENIDKNGLLKCEFLIEDQIQEQTDARLQSLLYFYDRFYDSIEEAGYSSRSQRYVHIACELNRQNIPWNRIIFSGFFGLTSTERKLFEKILSWEKSFALFQESPELKEQLFRLGIEWQSEKSNDNTGPTIYFHRSPDVHGQAFVLGGLLNQQKRQEEQKGSNNPSLSRTSVILPLADTLFTVLSNSIPTELGDYFNISLGYPLERTPTWGFINSLIQLGLSATEGGLYIPDYLSFILHPYTKNIYLQGQSETTRIMFHAIEERLHSERTKSFVTIDEVEEDQELFELICSRISGVDIRLSTSMLKEHLKVIHDELIRKILVFISIGDFASRIMDVLSYIYDHSSARLHPFFHPFAEFFIEQLELLRRSRVSNLSFTENHSYFNMLRRYVSHCFVPFEGTPLNGMQVLGFLETRNLSFEHVYVLDMNEGILPENKKDESFIPSKVRVALGLPIYKDKDKISAHYFNTLLAGAKEVHLFYTDNDRKEKSRFVEKLIWEKQLKDGRRSDLSYVTHLNYKLSLDAHQPMAIVKTPEIVENLKSYVYTATSLDSYLICPIKFYYKYVFKLSKKNDIENIADKMDIGTLVHRILFNYFDSRVNFLLSENDLNLSEMEAIIQNIFLEVYGSDHQGSALLLKRQITNQLKAFLQKYMIPLVNQVRLKIIGLEYKIETNYNGFRFQGILDRVERRNDEVFVIDYKTGNSRSSLKISFDKFDPDDRRNWSSTIGTLQLPLYHFLYNQTHRNDADSNCIFLLLGKAHINHSIELPIADRQIDIQMGYQKMKDVILKLTNEIIDIKIPFDSSFRSEEACVFCDYQFMCGTQWQGR
jgi:ATP-dependent helicase/nuclease subunit B